MALKLQRKILDIDQVDFARRQESTSQKAHDGEKEEGL